MRTILFISTLLLCFLSSFAYIIEAYVVDNKGNLIEGANCICFSLPDSIFHNATVTDKKGHFELEVPESNWYLNISSLGYTSARVSQNDYLNFSKTNLPINIIISPKESELNEVVVTASKGIMSIKNDIISFKNLDEIIESRAITSAHELLYSLPLISSADGSSITLAGAPLGSAVYINGRASKMSQTDLMDYLKSVPPGMVKDIEIIYTPSPKWKTKNSVINVNLKGSNAYTFNGRVNASGTFKHDFSGRLGTSLFFALPKFNFDAGYYYKCSQNINKEVLFSHHIIGELVTDIHNTELTKSLTNAHNLFAQINYDINQQNSLTLNYNGQFIPQNNASVNTYNNVFGIYNSNTKSDNNFNAITLTYNNKNGINVGLEYHHYKSNQNQAIANNEENMSTTFLGLSSQEVDKVKAYIDANTALKKSWVLSYGASYEFTRNINKQITESDDPYMESQNIKSTVNESIADLYLGIQKSFFNRKLSLSAYLKGENYRIGKYKRNQLLPSAVITYIPNYTHIFQASYQSFKNYPNFWQRQDYKSYTNPYQLSEGNPDLKPATYNVVSLLYMFKQKYTINISYYHVKDFFLNQMYQSPKDLVVISKPYNIDSSSLFDITLTIPVSIKNIFFSNISLNTNWERNKSSDWHGLDFDKSKFGGAVMVDNTITILNIPKISINVTGMYKLPSLLGLWEREHAWMLNAGVSGAFFNDKLAISLKGFDLLESLYPKSKIRLDSQCMNLNSNFYSRYFTLELSYNFKGYKEHNIKSSDTSRYGF